MTQIKDVLLEGWKDEIRAGEMILDEGTESKSFVSIPHVMQIIPLLIKSIGEDQKEKDIRIVADHFSTCGDRHQHPCDEHETALMNLIQNQ